MEALLKPNVIAGKSRTSALEMHMLHAPPVVPLCLKGDERILTFEECFGDAVLNGFVPGTQQLFQKRITGLNTKGFATARKADSTGAKKWRAESFRYLFLLAATKTTHREVCALWRALPEGVRYEWWMLEIYLYVSFPFSPRTWADLTMETPEGLKAKLYHPRVVSAMIHCWPLSAEERVLDDFASKSKKALWTMAELNPTAEMTWQAYSNILKFMSLSTMRVAYINLVRSLLFSTERNPDAWCTHLRPKGGTYPVCLIREIGGFCKRTFSMQLLADVIDHLYTKHHELFVGLAPYLDSLMRGAAAETEGSAHGAVHLVNYTTMLPLKTLRGLVLLSGNSEKREEVRCVLAQWARHRPLRTVLEEGVRLAMSERCDVLLEVVLVKLVSLHKVEDALRILATIVKSDTCPDLSPTPASYAVIMYGIRHLPLEEAEEQYRHILLLPNLPPAPEVFKALMNLRVYVSDMLSVSENAVTLTEGLPPLLVGRTKSNPNPVSAAGTPKTAAREIYLSAMSLSLALKATETMSKPGIEAAFELVEEVLEITEPWQDIRLLKALPHFGGCRVMSDLTREFYSRLAKTHKLGRERHPHLATAGAMNRTLQLHIGIQAADKVVLLDVAAAKRLVLEHDILPVVKPGHKVLIPYSTLVTLFDETENACEHDFLFTGRSIQHDALRKLAEAIEQQPTSYIVLTLVAELTFLASSLWGTVKPQNVLWAARLPDEDKISLPETHVSGYLEAKQKGETEELADLPKPLSHIDTSRLVYTPESVVVGQLSEVLLIALRPFALKLRKVFIVDQGTLGDVWKKLGSPTNLKYDFPLFFDLSKREREGERPFLCSQCFVEVVAYSTYCVMYGVTVLSCTCAMHLY